MEEIIEFQVGEEDASLRLDLFLYDKLEGWSRSKCQELIRRGKVRVEGRVVVKPAHVVKVRERVEVILEPAKKEEALLPENIPIEIIYEDNEIVVVNKQAGLVVHPAPGHLHGTLVNALIYHCKDYFTSGDPLRPGVVHRLDMNTTGVLVFAKNPRAYLELRRQVENREFKRRYLALVKGVPLYKKGIIDASIGRSLADRKKMSVTGVNSKDAVTSYSVKEIFGELSLLELELSTGRTHQIRVHLKFIGHPVIGDPVYGFIDYGALKLSRSLIKSLENLPGQALHAQLLGIKHPITNEYMEFTAPLPRYFEDILNLLRQEFVPQG
ncbi:MAG: RluA family pseudouridine synthase [Candidatus Hydrogenedentes bacterium]|nr:RluA family pseudouridine synthase [Candidatus Hydrogenedentota bacterium]